jgi:hypothetical protein
MIEKDKNGQLQAAVMMTFQLLVCSEADNNISVVKDFFNASMGL